MYVIYIYVFMYVYVFVYVFTYIYMTYTWHIHDVEVHIHDNNMTHTWRIHVVSVVYMSHVISVTYRSCTHIYSYTYVIYVFIYIYVIYVFIYIYVIYVSHTYMSYMSHYMARTACSRAQTWYVHTHRSYRAAQTWHIHTHTDAEVHWRLTEELDKQKTKFRSVPMPKADSTDAKRAQAITQRRYEKVCVCMCIYAYIRHIYTYRDPLATALIQTSWWIGMPSLV